MRLQPCGRLVTSAWTQDKDPGERCPFSYFTDCRGPSPLRYLRDGGFGMVREALKRGQGEGRVAEAAIRCGFCHLGRFAVEYRRRFGESPSGHTLEAPGARVTAPIRIERNDAPARPLSAFRLRVGRVRCTPTCCRNVVLRRTVKECRFCSLIPGSDVK